MDGIIIPPTKMSLTEALSLAEEILRNIELSDIPLTNIALKTSRLARLINDFDMQKIMEYESGGYPCAPGGFSTEVWRLCEISGRVFQEKDEKNGNVLNFSYPDPISKLEEIIKVSESALDAARDPNVSLTSANPHQYVSLPATSNKYERSAVLQTLGICSTRLANRRSFIHSYVQNRYYELKYSKLARDIFSETQKKVDEKIGNLLPNSIKKITAVYDYLLSENPEDWANAVHSCRRILQDLADAIFPPVEGKRKKVVAGKEIEIKLGTDEYINRIMAYVEDNSRSERFEELVGSQLTYLGDRLDAIFRATQKGSHGTVEKEEANRYVIYTYLLVGDLLSLSEQKEK